MIRTRLAVVAGLVALLLVWCLPSPARAQQAQPNTASQADIQRLQILLSDANNDVEQLRSRDPRLADQLQTDLDNLRDEVTYLKVKMRKEGNVPRDDYYQLRDRLDDLRGKARGDATRGGAEGAQGAPPRGQQGETPRQTEQPPAPPRTAGSGSEVPVGTELDVRLAGHLSSGTSQPEDRFEATTMVDLLSGNRVLIPAGSTVRGVVTAVDKATRTDRTGKLTLSFDQLTVHGRAYPIHATVTQQPQSAGVRGEAGKIGAGAAVGAIIGGIIGGAKGVLAGILVGGGGTMAATPGKDVDLPPGTVLRLRFDSAVNLAAR